MKKILAGLFMLLLLQTTSMAQQKVIPLYEGMAPGSESWTWGEAENDNNAWQTKVVYNVSKPTLTVFTPAAGMANGTAIIIAPGGAFHALSINSEGYDVAKWLAQKGVTCFVLKYRLVHCKTTDPVAEVTSKWGKKEFEEDNAAAIPLAIADGRAAIAYVRNHAGEYGIVSNSIGIMGFSAGGTVAASSLFNYTKENRPDFAAPVYPYFPAGLQSAVAADAPPLFIVTATDDGLGLAPHSVDLYSKWLANKKDAELHMYARGNHGFGMRTQNLPTDKWIERFGEWMDVQGLLKVKPKKTAAPVNSYNSFEKKEFIYADGKVLPYRIQYPVNYDKNKKYPLVVFLHGSGERGSDNEKQLVHGARLFATNENREKFAAIVVFPQCPENSTWTSVNVDRTKTPLTFSFNYDNAITWPLDAVNKLTNQLLQTESIDKQRCYVTGLSMGGMGTFELVYRFPKTFAAALPICGGGDAMRYDERVKKTVFWIFHGDADAAVNVNESRAMVNKLKNLKINTTYTEYPGVNHNSWDNAFAEPTFLSWMFSNRRK